MAEKRTHGSGVRRRRSSAPESIGIKSASVCVPRSKNGDADTCTATSARVATPPGMRAMASATTVISVMCDGLSPRSRMWWRALFESIDGPVDALSTQWPSFE